MPWSADLAAVAGRLVPIALLGAVVLFAPSVNAAGASVTLNPAISTVKPGDHFRIDVVVTTDAPTRGLQLGIKFDPRLVQIDRVQNGPFYAGWASANGGQAANPVPFRPNNNTGDVPPGAVIILGGPPQAGPSGNGPALTLQMTARDNVNGRAPVEISTGVISSVQAQSMPNVVQTGGLVFVGIDSDGSTPRSGPLVDIAAAPPDIVFTKPNTNTNTQGTPTVPPAIALVPTLDPALIAGAVSKPVDIAPTAAAPTRPPVAAAPPTPLPAEQPAPAPQQAPPAPQQPPQQAPPAPQPPAQQAPPPVVAVPPPTPAPAAPAPTDVAPSPDDAAPSAPAPGSSVPAVVNAPQQVNLLATMSTLATAQAVPVARTPTPAAAPANGVRASSPVPRTQASFAAPVIRPTASSGLFIPWEVLAGVGGGLISAAIVLYAFRRPIGGPP
jgi:hypothetical protein